MASLQLAVRVLDQNTERLDEELDDERLEAVCKVATLNRLRRVLIGSPRVDRETSPQMSPGTGGTYSTATPFVM